MKKDHFFSANPQKSANKVTINSIMMGSLFFILTLIITLDPLKFHIWVIYQLVLAIPLLFVSSLAYSKIGYKNNIYSWDVFGWFTNTLGNLFVMNAVGLVASKFSLSLGYFYFVLLMGLMLVYTIINVRTTSLSKFSKIFKLLFLLAVVYIGGLRILLAL